MTVSLAESVASTVHASHVGLPTTRSACQSRMSAYRIKGNRLLSCCLDDDPRTRKGQRMQLLKILGMAAIPIVILVVQSSVTIRAAVWQRDYTRTFKDQVRFCTQAGAVVHAMGLERGITTFYVATTPPDGELLKIVMQQRVAVDAALSALTSWPDGNQTTDEMFQNKFIFLAKLYDHRSNVNGTSPQDQLRYYTRINYFLVKSMGNVIVQSQTGQQPWQHLTAYHMFISAKENFGAERGSGTVLFGQGKMTNEIYFYSLRKRYEAEAFLNKSRQYNPFIDRAIIRQFTGSRLEANITIQRNLIDANYINKTAIHEGRIYFDQMTAFLDILHGIEKILSDNLIENLNQSIRQSEITFAAELVVLLVSIILLPGIIVCLHSITGQIHHFATILQAKNHEINREKQRTEEVLHRLLPQQIADKIKNRLVVYPESYEQVTVFFSDIVDFTGFSATSTPMQVVDTLNKLYTVMDNRVEHYDVYKVETIGDAYLCVSGLPERNGNRHSYEIASMALEMLDDVARIKLLHKPDCVLRLRIGMHVGPCAAGIVGRQMPRYCIFGDTVNTASRMESTGDPLKIHISTTTYEVLQCFKVFEMECRGEITVKGKGKMTTFWLLRKRDSDLSPRRKHNQHCILPPPNDLPEIC